MSHCVFTEGAFVYATEYIVIRLHITVVKQHQLTFSL